jgi:hypothetical protein
LLSGALQKGHLPASRYSRIPFFTAVALIVLALLTAAALLPPSEKTKKRRPAEGTSEVFHVWWLKQKATEYSTLFPKKQRTTTQ